MSHFSLKSLSFYGVAITLVLVLFKVVTAYGESNLKVPKSIDGRYRLSYIQPNCRQATAPVLTIEQSGIYLNGSLLPKSIDDQQQTSAEKKSSLTGQMYNQQIGLSGTVPTSTLCSNISQTTASDRSKDNSFSSVNLQSRVQGETLEGQISVKGISEVTKFTAQRETPPQPSKNSSDH